MTTEKIEEHLVTVLHRITSRLVQGQWIEALIATHLILFRIDEKSAIFSKGPDASNFDQATVRETANWVLALSSALHQGRSIAEFITAQPIPSALRLQPRGLTLALEHLWLFEASLPDGSPAHSPLQDFVSFVGPHDLSWLAEARPDSGADDATCNYWVVRRALSFPRAATEERALHNQHFLAHTRIVGESQPNGFSIRAVPESDRLFRLFPSEGPPDGKVTVMVANFSVCELESQLVTQENGSIAFKARDVGNFNLITEELSALWRVAKAHHVDFVVLPELAIPPKVARFISNLQRNEDTHIPSLRLAFCGSFHVPAEANGEVKNVTLVMDRNGDEVPDWRHVKTQFVDLRKHGKPGAYEDIAIEKNITLFDTNWGVHCSVICLDLAQGDAKKIPWEKLPINWLWVPAMSQSVKAFYRPTESLILNSPSTVAVANQAVVDFGHDEVGNPIRIVGDKGFSGFIEVSKGLSQLAEGETDLPVNSGPQHLIRTVRNLKRTVPPAGVAGES